MILNTSRRPHCPEDGHSDVFPSGCILERALDPVLRLGTAPKLTQQLKPRSEVAVGAVETESKHDVLVLGLEG